MSVTYDTEGITPGAEEEYWTPTVSSSEYPRYKDWELVGKPSGPNDQKYASWLESTGFKPKDDYADKSYWFDNEYAKHIAGLRKRYPMLTRYLLNKGEKETANLSSPENTNKYARLADAYNATYIRQPGSVGQLGSGRSAYATLTGGQLQAVNKLETQDLKGMEQRRKAEDLLNQYTKEEESHYQRELLKNKMEAAKKYFNEVSDQQFYNERELMSRTSDLWKLMKDMSDYEYRQTLDKLGIKQSQMQHLIDARDTGDMWALLTDLKLNGVEGQTIDDVLMSTLSNDALSAALAGDKEGSLRAFERLTQQRKIIVIEELINAIKDSPNESIQQIEKMIRQALYTAGVAFNYIEQQIQKHGPKWLVGATALSLLGAPALSAIITGLFKFIPGGN